MKNYSSQRRQLWKHWSLTRLQTRGGTGGGDEAACVARTWQHGKADLWTPLNRISFSLLGPAAITHCPLWKSNRGGGAPVQLLIPVWAFTFTLGGCRTPGWKIKLGTLTVSALLVDWEPVQKTSHAGIWNRWPYQTGVELAWLCSQTLNLSTWKLPRIAGKYYSPCGGESNYKF